MYVINKSFTPTKLTCTHKPHFRQLLIKNRKGQIRLALSCFYNPAEWNNFNQGVQANFKFEDSTNLPARINRLRQ
jgi:hypothetical protein